MLTLVLFALAQAPASASAEVPVAIVVSSRRDTNGSASRLCEQLQSAIGPQAMSEKQSIERLASLGGVDPHACDGARLCLQKLAQLLHGVVIGVDVSKAGRLTAGHIEAVSFDRVESLASDDITSDARSWPTKAADAAKAFAQKLTPQLVAMRPKESPAASELKAPVLAPPQSVVLVPEPPPTPPPSAEAIVAKNETHATGPLRYIAAGAGVVSLALGVTFLALGFVDRGTYTSSFHSVPNQTALASSLRDDQLDALATSSNTKLSLGTTFTALAVVLGVVAGLLLAKD